MPRYLTTDEDDDSCPVCGGDVETDDESGDRFCLECGWSETDEPEDEEDEDDDDDGW